MSRRDQAPEVTELDDRGERREEHPAYAVAVVTRGSGTGRALFQSDLLHTQTITLAISTADRTRALHRDWVHPRRTLVEVEMSLAQWGALVSSIGLGSGVPVTLRRTESGPGIPGIVFEPRTAENVAEVRGSVDELLRRARETLAELERAIESKAGIRAVRDALRTHQNVIGNAPSNAAYAIRALNEATEHVVSTARSDIEAYILDAARLTGHQASIEVPDFTAPELEDRA